MMRVLYAFPEPLPLPHARGVQVAHTLAALLNEDCEVRLASTSDTAISEPLKYYGLHPDTPLELLRLTRRSQGFLSLFPIQSNRFFNQQLINWITHEIKRYNPPDVILTRHLKTAFALLNQQLDIPVVYEAHEVFARSAKTGKRRDISRMESQVLQHATRVISISNALADALKEEHGILRTYDVLHSGTNLPETISDKPWHACTQHIIYTGSLHGWKGIEDLIAAVRWLPNHRITIIGGTNDQISNLKKMVPKNGGDVVFHPYRPHAEIQAVLNEACIAVLPNRSGSISAWTSPLKLFEYMGTGCAIVASDLPSIREILTPQDISLVPPEDPRALAKAIQALTDHPQHAATMGNHLRKIAVDYSWQNRGRRLAEILRHATTSKPSPDSLINNEGLNSPR